MQPHMVGQAPPNNINSPLAIPPASTSSVHIFTPLIQLPRPLAQELQARGISYQLHSQYSQLHNLVTSNYSNFPLLVLVESDPSSKSNPPTSLLFPKNYNFPRNQANIFLQFYSISTQQPPHCLQGSQKVADWCQQHITNIKGSNNPRRKSKIQFKSVRSLSRSTQKAFRSQRSPQPRKQSNPVSYEKLFYQEGDLSNLEYKDLTESIKNASSFSNYEELALEIRGRNQKYLVLTHSQAVGQLLVNLKKYQVSHFDIVLFGQVQPVSLYLDPAIVLATKDHDIVSQFLGEQGFEILPKLEQPKLLQRCSMSSTDFKNIMNKIMREDSEYSTNNIFRSSFRSGMCIEEKVVRYWQVDKDPRNLNSFMTTEVIDSSFKIPEFADSLKIRRLKHPGKSMYSQKTEKDEQDMNFNMTKRSSAPFNNKLLQTQTQKSSSEKEMPQGKFPDMASSSPVKNQTPAIQPIFTYNFAQKDYPSNVIPEVSEEYRMSNNTSMIYPQNSYSHRQLRQHPSNYYLTENSPSPNRDERRRATKQSTSWRQSDSQQSFKSNDHLISEVKAESTHSVKAPQVFPISPIKSQHRAEAAYHSPIRVVRKTELSTPEEVKYRSPNSNHDTTKKIVHSNRPQQQQRIAERKFQGDNWEPLKKQERASKNFIPHQEKKPTPEVKSSFQRQFQGFEKVEKDGIVIYRRKEVSQENAPTKSIQNKINPNSGKVGSPVRQVGNPFRLKSPPRRDPKLHEKSSQPDDINLFVDSTHKKTITTENSNTQDKQDNRKTFSIPLQTANRLEPVRKLNKQQNNFIHNDSMHSRISQLHSDGSILRRNNMRFGVKPLKREEKIEPSMLMQESKIKSTVQRPIESTVKKNGNRMLNGEDSLNKELDKLQYVNTKFNNFHFLIHEELAYLHPMFQVHLARPQDRLQTFSSLQQMFECIRPEKTNDLFDAGFIVTLRQHLPLINPKILPEDYYLLVIDRSRTPFLEINEENRKVRIDQLGQLSLVQKMLIQQKLYKYVAYGSKRREVCQLADKFMETDFVLEKIETEFTSQILDFYYCELPRVTRLYILCCQQEINSLQKLLTIYHEFNPSFEPRSVKLLCLITNILGNDELIMANPGVTFINNPEELRSYKDILAYAHYSDEQPPPFPLDHFFYPQNQTSLELRLDTTFPGRFQPVTYQKLTDLPPKLEKIEKMNVKYGIKTNSYLLLPENLSGEKVSSLNAFSKIFMLGKGKSMQSNIQRVLNQDELIQHLKP